MYCLQIGRGLILGHVTAGDLWQDQNLQVRCRNSITPIEFQQRLNTGEILKFNAATVWLKGETVHDNINAYLEKYRFSLNENYRSIRADEGYY